jgi:tRNA nucleotidyltransferase (CCA-adding enzyme)
MIPIPEDAKKIMNKLESEGFKAYIVGGFVRDSLLCLSAKDVDIFTDCEDILKVFPNGKVLGGEERQTKILTVIVNGIEVSTFRGNGERTQYGKTIAQHQATCDLTINAIAINSKGILDGSTEHNEQGVEDVCRRKIRFVGKPIDRIKEDKLRIFRFVRFLLKFNGSPTIESVEAIKQNVKLLLDLPKERIREELIKCLKYDNCLNVLNEFEILGTILPQWKPNEDLKGGKHHNETVGRHMFKAYEVACSLTDDWRIRIASFLHDIGKAESKQEDEENITFIKHEHIGSSMVKEWMTEYKFSNEDIKFITTLIRFHMYEHKEINKKSYLKMFNEFKEAGISLFDYLVITYSDNQANLSKPRIKFIDFCNENKTFKAYLELIKNNDPFNKSCIDIKGGELITLFNLKPSKLIGEITDKVFNAITNDQLVNNKTEIIKWIKQNIKEVQNENDN